MTGTGRMRDSAALRAIAVLFLAVLVLAGCSHDPEGPSAEQVGDLYFMAVQRGDFEVAASMYDPGVPHHLIVEELRETQERIGPLEDYTMTDLVSYIAGGARSYTLKFKTRYEEQHATESLLLQPGADNRLYIKRNEFQTGRER